MNIKPISSAHTMNCSFHGTSISASVEELVAAFGKPPYIDNTGEDKVNYEWCLQLDGEPFTIYDWKEYETPMGLHQWHIGGRSNLAVARVQQAFKQGAKV